MPIMKQIAVALVTFARFVSFAYVVGSIPGIQLIKYDFL